MYPIEMEMKMENENIVYDNVVEVNSNNNKK